ncbi:putative MO25-like protein At5g47540 [Phragmites australis]|uniref:putative MO25-like protein At5g47540 n=1 Tax=Phragmites australis TaxID=29695 RepID=UPI002D79BAE5|nr:putative MO25-like protein At5g47540 [Phragmites australis]
MTGCLWPCAAAAIATVAAAMGSGAGRRGWGLFRSKTRSPMEVVRHTRDLLSYVAENLEACNSSRDAKREQKMADLRKNIREMKCILYGNGEAEPVTEACTNLTKEFFKENTNTLRLLIVCLPYLDLETQKDVTQIVANLQRQKVDSRIIASDYLDANKDLLDTLMFGYDNLDIAIHYSTILRDCIRHQVAAWYVLESEHMRKFFDYIQLPDFNIASDAFRTFKELLTRHKSSAAEFLSKNYDWFFSEFNSKLLSSPNYIIRRQATQLLGDVLLDRSNTTMMVCYVNSKENLIVLMNLLREQSKVIQVEAFHVFKLFAVNQNKPREIVGILSANKNKILRFLADFTLDKEDNQFEVDKAKVIAEISAL